MSHHLRLVVLGTFLGCLLGVSAWAETAPQDFILDQGQVLSPQEHRALSERLKDIAAKESVRVYFVSFKDFPQNDVNDSITRYHEVWLGSNLGGIYFYAADSKQFLATASPGLSKALGRERLNSLGAALAEPRPGGGLTDNVFAFADAVLKSVREAGMAARGDLPDRPMEWNPATEDWTPLLQEQEKREDELAWAANLEGDVPEGTAAGLESKSKLAKHEDSSSTGVNVVLIACGLVAVAGGIYLFKLLRHERVLERSYQVPRISEPVAPRFGALASGGCGASIDLRERKDSAS